MYKYSNNRVFLTNVFYFISLRTFCGNNLYQTSINKPRSNMFILNNNKNTNCILFNSVIAAWCCRLCLRNRSEENKYTWKNKHYYYVNTILRIVIKWLCYCYKIITYKEYMFNFINFIVNTYLLRKMWCEKSNALSLIHI